MTHDQMLQEFDTIMAEIRDLMSKKNRGYSRSDDCLANFRSYNIAGVSVPQGILTRMVDKISRLGNMVEDDWRKAHSDAAGIESVEDTIRDLIVYSFLLSLSMRGHIRPEQVEISTRKENS